MNPVFVYLLLASCACLVILVACSLLLMRDQRLIRQRMLRINAVVSGHRVSRSNGLSSGYRLDLELQGATFVSRAAKFLRYDPAHQAAYPAKPS